jgi:hypothetical protein
MKRFTETAKWSDPFFRQLSPVDKLAFIYALDNCDNAGVWQPDPQLAEFQIGATLDLDKFRATLGDRVRLLPNGKWYFTRFLRYQYVTFSEASAPHQSIIRLLYSHGIGSEAIPLLEAGDRDKDKTRTGKGKGKGQDTDIPSGIEEVESYAAELGLDAAEAAKFYDHFEANGWRPGGRAPMRSWRAALRNWARRTGEFAAGKKTSRTTAGGAPELPFDPAKPDAHTGGIPCADAGADAEPPVSEASSNHAKT